MEDPTSTGQEERARILGNMLPRQIPQLPKECDEKAGPGELNLTTLGLPVSEMINPRVSLVCVAGHP